MPKVGVSIYLTRFSSEHTQELSPLLTPSSPRFSINEKSENVWRFVFSLLIYQGTWATYIVITLILHLLFFVNPWLNAAWAWTLTNTIHNLGNFLLLHMTKGDFCVTSNVLKHEMSLTFCYGGLFGSPLLIYLIIQILGTPWMPMDEGKARYLTQWEQLDHGMQFTATKKFLTVIPIVLFFLAR